MIAKHLMLAARILLAGPIVLLVWLASVAAQTLDVRPTQWAKPEKPVAGVPNFFQVAPNFYRSAQPTPEGFRTLSVQYGVRTVISMRANHSDDRLVEGTDIRAVRFSTNTWSINRASVENALRTLRQATQTGPVLLHCQHGADRTGLVAALYRVLYQGWSKEEALKEMREGGFGYHAVWGNIPKFVQTVDMEDLRRRVEAR